jgi:hypothetical protein
LVRAPGLEPGTSSNSSKKIKENLLAIRKILSNQSSLALEKLEGGSLYQATQLLRALAELTPKFSTLENPSHPSNFENQDNFQTNSCKTEENPPQFKQERGFEGRRG